MSVQAQLQEEDIHASISLICRVLDVPRRSFYYKSTASQVPLKLDKVAQVKAVIDRFPTYGYRRIAVILGWNRKVVQRICQRMNWQVRKRPRGFRPRVKAMPSVAPQINQRWSTDLAMVWCGRDRWCHIAIVIDCCSREVLGWRLSKRGNAKTAESALEEALIHRYGHLGRVPDDLLLRSDNGLVFTSKMYTRTVRAYGLQQEFITPYSPEQNGLVERFIRSFKEECVWQHRFESIVQADAVIRRWMRHYNTERPHQALGYQVPVQIAA